MDFNDLLRNGERKLLLALAEADDTGVRFKPADDDRQAVRLVKRGFATRTDRTFTITDAGWAWLRDAIDSRIPHQVADATELPKWRAIHQAYRDIGLDLPAID
ncbi:hypothetical protein AB0K52_22275 [Glycomyces sp. NPDC049804]|uniref:hypothetical protein n=1 Tax=Glycomyces sp. NPDC049804 TaxID=3154363 RepID=UPI003431C30F